MRELITTCEVRMSTEGNQPNPELSDEDQFAEFLKQSEEQAQPEPEQEPTAAEPEKPDPEVQTQAPPKPGNLIDELPEEWRERVRQEFEAREQKIRDLDNRHKAQMGQLAPTQRKLAELERQLSEANKRQESKPAGMSEGAWARYKKEFAEESQAIEELVNPLREQLKTATEQLAEWRQEKEFAEATQALAKEHPDWQQLDNDPVFGEWFDAQPPQVKRMFPEGQRADPADVAWLIREFKRAEQMAEILEKSNQPAPAQADPKASAVAARREQQKRDPVVGIRTGQSTASGRRNATGDSEEDAFAAYLAENPP